MNINEIPKSDDILNPTMYFGDYELDDEIKLIKDNIDTSKINCKRFKSGYSIFDEAMKGGFKGGDLVIISGISGQGKTTFAQSLTYNLCKQNIPCLWFSYEVSLEHLHGKFVEMGLDEFYQAYAPKRNTTGKLEWIKRKIREGKTRFGTKMIFIDHIDFLTPTDIKTSDNQAIALKNIAIEIKNLAIELDVTIVLMAHLKKMEKDREPDMQDIGYSAGVFQLADYVIMIYREKAVREKSKYGESFEGDIYTNNSIVKYVKNRETGSLKFIKCQLINQRFVEQTTLCEPNLSYANFN